MRPSTPSLVFVLCATVASVACDRAVPTSVGPTQAYVTDLQAHHSVGTSQMVPFKARYTFFQVVPGPAEPCGTSGINRTFVEGEGIGTHLGRFTIRLSQCGLADGVLADGRGTFVAANGDLLRFTYTGQATFTGTLLTFVSFVTFTGGTGRFDGASGAATARGSIDLVTGATAGDWDGLISSVGSNEP